MHTWPAFVKQAGTAAAAALPTSASSSTIIAFLPPSSSEQPIRRAAARSATTRPLPLDPVNPMKSACSTRAPPVVGPSPTTTWKTPLGSPARSSSSAPSSGLSEVWLSGLTTTAHLVERVPPRLAGLRLHEVAEGGALREHEAGEGADDAAAPGEVGGGPARLRVPGDGDRGGHVLGTGRRQHGERGAGEHLHRPGDGSPGGGDPLGEPGGQPVGQRGRQPGGEGGHGPVVRAM